MDWKALKFTVVGGMALKHSVAEDWSRRTHTKVLEGYGLTEASPAVACNPADGKTDRLGTIGLPLPSTDIKIINSQGGEVDFGVAGELCVKGPQVMRGYFKAEEETKLVFTADGWLKTGDIAILAKDGFLTIVDRLKDMVLVSGFKVFPNEVEDAAMLNPKILEAAVVGVPDEHSGEAVKIFIVKKDSSLTETEVREFLKEKLTGYKRPKYIEFRSILPKNNVGKFLRRELRDHN